jgi:hypothetical protein
MNKISQYLRDKSDQQLKMISALILINKENVPRFPATLVAKKISSNTQKMGGGWTSLTRPSENMPPLVLRAGKKMEKNTEGERKYTPLWVINRDIDWESMEEEIKQYSWIK